MDTNFYFRAPGCTVYFAISHLVLIKPSVFVDVTVS